MKRKNDNTNEDAGLFATAKFMTLHHSEGSSASIEYARKSKPLKQNASSCTEALNIIRSLFEKKRKAQYK